MRQRRLWLFVFLAVALGLAVGVVRGSAGTEDGELPPEFVAPLARVLQKIEDEYPDDVDRSRLVVGAVQGVLGKLDEHSTYMPPELMREFEADTRGEFGGLGIEIRYDEAKKVVVVAQTIPGTPAFEQGVLSGDMIVRIQQQGSEEVIETKDFEDVYDAVDVLRGDPGTQVVITVIRGDPPREKDITVTRDIIKVPGVRAVEMLDAEQGIGYVYLAYFHERAVRELLQAIQELRDQGAEGIILDVRFNPGGLLSSALEMANLFLDSRVIVSIKGRNGPQEIYTSQPGDVFPNLSLVVLMNRHSASAAEIVAAALAENDRARLVGESTHGKATVQQVFPLQEGSRDDGFKMTIAHYYTPNGTLIAEQGVAPDVEVELEDEELLELALALSKKAAYPPEDEEPQVAESAPAEDADEEVEADAENPDEEDSEPFHDRQLERAVEVMKQVIAARKGEQEPAAEPVAASS